MIFPTRDATLALAGVIQPLLWVHDIAAHGLNRPERLAHSMNAVLCTDPENVLAVYGDLPQLGDGIKRLSQILLGRGDLAAMEQALITRYAGQILRLGVRVRQDSQIAARIAEGLAAVAAIPEDAENSQQARLQKLAETYVAYISPLKPRVMVSGQPETLKNHEYVTAIRCHLLASVRSAVLWHQCGGRFWQLILLRGFWLKQARLLTQG